mmetsp:Transcript_97955/g.299384  ORF Transcript_97955/g.299384 Transcript_97955/m.299384 type:complete len:215 (-) Transcript_97955:316-960(-)
MPRYNHSLGSSAPDKGWPCQLRKRAQYRAGWIIWFAGLKTIGQKSGSMMTTGSHLPVFCTTNNGSISRFTQSSSILMVMTPMELLAPTTTLSSPCVTTRHSQGMFRNAKNRTSGPKIRCASKCTRPWAKMVPTAVLRTSTYGRMCSNISFVVVTGPVQRTMSDCGMSSAGSSETLCNRPSCTAPHGNVTRGFLFCQTCGLLVSSCVLTRPFVFS